MGLKIVFDLDGTLITCENKQKFVLFAILNSLSQSNGTGREKLDPWWKLKRSGLSTEQALIRMNISNARLIADEWRRIVENHAYCSLDQPFDDSLYCLRYLKDKLGFTIFILTSRNCRFHVLQSMDSYGFSQHIDDLIVVKPDTGPGGKTDYLQKISPAVFIGDSELDYQAALHAGTSFIALTRGQRSREFLSKAGITKIEDNLSFINGSFIHQIF